MNDPMTLETAKTIMRNILPRRKVAETLAGLLSERAAHAKSGRVTEAQQVSRTIEDMAGHWADGVFVGAAEIAEASRLTTADAHKYDAWINAWPAGPEREAAQRYAASLR